MNQSFKNEMSFDEAIVIASELKDKLTLHPDIKDVIIAGSLRRGKSKVNDIDLVIFSAREFSPEFIHELLPDSTLIVCGSVKVSLVYKEVQVDLNRYFNKSIAGAFLLHNTGSAEYNIRLRKRAMSFNFSLSQNGLLNKGANPPVLMITETEEDVFKLLGLEYVDPSRRD